MTGWGQTGPFAEVAGHDMNYIAVAGALHGLGQDPDRPSFPSNLVGDFGGGSTYLVIGVLAALLEARVSGQGQVIDAAIVDGAAHLNAMTLSFVAGGSFRERRAANLLDGGAPYYDVYETADGKHMSVGPLEPQFYELFVDLLGIRETAPDRYDLATYPELRRVIAEAFAARTQADWVKVFEGTDACVAGIIPLTEAFTHPHMTARRTYVEHEGVTQPAPAPRFSRTAPSLSLAPAPQPGTHTRDALAAWGVADVDGLIERGAAVQP